MVEREDNAVTQREQDKPTSGMTLLPPVDIFEDSTGVTLYADLPGVTKDTLEINVHDGNLRIEGEAVVAMPAGLRVRHAEIRQPHFSRAFTLSPDLDASRIEASLQDGVLKLTIPRREEARPRRISVNVG
jgi:HSP20 family molecular chaperone IbpA